LPAILRASAEFQRVLADKVISVHFHKRLIISGTDKQLSDSQNGLCPLELNI
jgi:hypothetical protein